MKTHAAEHGIDPARVFVGGHSAGAYLTAMVGLDARLLEPYHLTPDAIARLGLSAGSPVLALIKSTCIEIAGH